MKRTKKLWTTMILLLMFCILAVFTAEAEAKEPSCVKTMNCDIISAFDQSDFDEDDREYDWSIANYNSFIFIKNLSKNAKITNIKSSNKYITVNTLKPYKKPSKKAEMIFYAPAIDLGIKDGNKIGPGSKTTISFKVKQNKKTYNLKCIVTLVEQKNPIKSFKVGNKEYANKFGAWEVQLPSSGKAKISYKAASGFKITKVTAYTSSGKSKKLSNGSTVDTKKYSYLRVEYKTTKKPANYKIYKWVSYKLPGYLYDQFSVNFSDYD